MALDQQRNWTVAMAENLHQVTGRGTPSKQPMKKKKDATNEARSPPSWSTLPVYLPDEIILEIVEYLSRFPDARHTLAACCLLSRQWHAAAVPSLYARPWLVGKNFDSFVRAICPSINLHVRKSPLSELVKTLDMSQLIHSSSKSTTARMLGRTKGNLEEFIAPQSGFTIHSFPPLGKCQHLQCLDLSLVSESPPLMELFKTLARLENLKNLRLPRSAGFSNSNNVAAMTWPPNLEYLCLSGGIDAHFLRGTVSFPESLRSLTIEHCPTAKTAAIMHLLATAVRPLPNLETLKLAHLPRLIFCSLDDILYYLPGLKKLSVSVDYITPAVFDLVAQKARADDFSISLPSSTRHDWGPGLPCHLRTLELTNSGNPGTEDKISPIDVLIAIDEGTLPSLRQVRVANTLFWHSQGNAADTEALADALLESAKQRGDEDPAGTGVWTFEG